MCVTTLPFGQIYMDIKSHSITLCRIWNDSKCKEITPKEPWESSWRGEAVFDLKTASFTKEERKNPLGGSNKHYLGTALVFAGLNMQK